MGQGDLFHKIRHVCPFRGLRLQKFPSGRCIEKQISGDKCGSVRRADLTRPISSPPSILYLDPVRLPEVFVISSTWETAAILESASPRNPREETVSRSSAVRILLVEWRKNANGSSSFLIPHPLSVIRKLQNMRDRMENMLFRESEKCP